MSVLDDLDKIAAGEGDIELAALRVRRLVALLMDAADDVARIQINRRSPANDLGKAKQIHLRNVLAAMRESK